LDNLGRADLGQRSSLEREGLGHAPGILDGDALERHVALNPPIPGMHDGSEGPTSDDGPNLESIVELEGGQGRPHSAHRQLSTDRNLELRQV
jgi:hypothetical protein